MHDMKQLFNLVDSIEALREAVPTNIDNDPALREILRQAVSLAKQMENSDSWTADLQSKQKMIEALTRVVKTLQTVSNNPDTSNRVRDTQIRKGT